MDGADNYIYEDTYEVESIGKPFINKEIRQVYDSNNGVYNNQILFSTQSLTNSGKWADFQNSYIQIPFVMAMHSTADIGAASNAFMMGLKDSSIQIVDSIVLQYNGTSMAQPSIFTNVMQHFKILASWTQDDLTKWGDATLTAPDETASFKYSAGGSVNGDGLSNNVISEYDVGAAFWVTQNGTYNKGLRKRMQTVAMRDTGYGSIPLKADQAGPLGRSHWTKGADAANQTFVWQVMLTLRLKDLHDFFDKVPLLKPAKIDLTINLNSFGGSVTYTTATGSNVSTSYNQTSGHSCPFMIASGAGVAAPYSDQPLSALGNNTVLTVGCGINGVRTSPLFSGVQSDIFQNCRWYVPLYEMNPEYEASLLQANPLKTIYYDDFYTFTSINAQSGSFSTLLSAGVRNPKYLVMYPFYNSADANSGNVLGNSPYQSFFDSAPGTPSPVTLTNIQVQVGGKTLFPLIEQYNFQQFMDEFSAIFAVDGGKSQKGTSGLITADMWQNAPVYVADLSRRLPQDDYTSQSVQISATVASLNASGTGAAVVDIIAFVVYERSATFNLLNGLLESSS